MRGRSARGQTARSHERSESAAEVRGHAEVTVVSEAIERIRNGEREAEEIERSARADAKALIADAHDAAERALDGTRKAAREEETALKTRAVEEAEAEAQALVAESRSSVEGVKASAEQRVEEGIKKVMELVTAGTVGTRG